MKQIKTLFPMKILLNLISLILFSQFSYSQNFVKITDTNNPIVTETLSGTYIGTSWTDIDNDGKLDLYINRKAVYKNLGDGNFIKLETAMGNQSPNLSNTWADYNNDGFIDCFVAATGDSNSFLYKNEGNGIFNKIRTGIIGDSSFNTGWGCAWGDYDNDGFTDLVIAAANNFGAVNHPNRLYHNSGDGTFTRVNVAGLTDTLGPFTVPTWSDYDQDGDIDLFIGCGPGGSTSQDYLYKNLLTESGTASLVRLNLPPLSTDLHDGQVWNLIDYDNDGDLDAFVTNYANSVPNNLYKNNGDGTYVKMTAAQVGTIVSDFGMFLTNLWGDFDNDGDLDCFVTRESGTSLYYSNDGDGTFTRIDNLAVTINSGNNYGATAGDYDNNGSLDLFVAGTTNTKGLFRNDLTNGNKWINIKCNGAGPSNSGSNKSAIGARLKAKATINGVPTWQYRDVLAQNSFNSMNMLNVHFGFGNATIIDSLIIIWPRGLREVATNISLNSFYNANEGQGIISGISNFSNKVPDGFKLYQNYPNPFNPNTVISYQLTIGSYTKLRVYNILGDLVE
ncbi:MAG: CRTAC1 family protein, partial [bacterium]